MNFIFHDGGRADAGFKGSANDCVTRAIAIATGRPYSEIYSSLAAINGETRKRRSKTAGKKSARNGIFTNTVGFKRFMGDLGFKWTPTMTIGSGCKVHLVANELPSGTLIVAVSRHYTTVIDGTIYDTFNPERETGRCVYGYWTK